jgi:hypothetical protein
MIDRRTFLTRSALLGGGLLAGGPALAADGKKSLPGFYADIERRTFNFFWETVNKANGLVPDRWPTPSFASIAAVGFGLTAYPIGVARGWIKREEARDLTLTTLRFFDNAPMGDDRTGMTGHRGFFYHFLDMKTGTRFRETELSSVDSSLLFLGMLFAGQWYDRNDPAEAEIRRLSAAIVDRADWPWFQRGELAVSMGWDPVKGFIARNWDGYNEGMMVYILGLGATRRPLPDDAWSAWTAPYPRYWRGEGPTRHLGFGPLFGHQYSHMWIDFRGIQDVTMRGAGFDYFENSRRAVLAQRQYCTLNPLKWDGYSKHIWGLTACDGPGGFKLPFKGETREFFAYAARGPIGQPDERDDGTIAPTAALGSLAFAPEVVIPAARALRKVPRLYGKYGFLDSFNPSFRYTDQKVQTGSVDKRHGWVAEDYLGIDQGPILGAAANYRDEMIWKTMRNSPVIRRGLERAGFTGGWLVS